MYIIFILYKRVKDVKMPARYLKKTEKEETKASQLKWHVET